MLPIGAAARIPQKPSAVNSFQRIGQQPFTSLFTTVRHPIRSKSSLSPHNVNTKPRLSLESQSPHRETIPPEVAQDGYLVLGFESPIQGSRPERGILTPQEAALLNFLTEVAFDVYVTHLGSAWEISPRRPWLD